jgi:hypothetical protein
MTRFYTKENILLQEREQIATDLLRGRTAISMLSPENDDSGLES